MAIQFFLCEDKREGSCRFAREDVVNLEQGSNTNLKAGKAYSLIATWDEKVWTALYINASLKNEPVSHRGSVGRAPHS